MPVLVSLTVGLVIWIVLWAFGAKAFDSFLITIVLVLMAATLQMAKPYIDRLLKP
jgi:hypothetical protein